LEYEKDDQQIAGKLSQQFEKIIWSVNREIGFYDIVGIKVLLCHSYKEFKDLKELAGKLPDQSVAFANPRKKSITLQNPKNMPAKSDYYQILKHEYCHILLRQISSGATIPLWFEEGFAQYFAKQWNFTKEVKFVTSALTGNTLDLNRYKYHYPLYNDRIEMFYLQSYYDFKFLINKFSFLSFQKFLEKMHRSGNFTSSFYQIYGKSITQFLEQAKKSIKSHVILSVFYSGFGLIWTVIPFLLLIAYIRKKIKMRGIRKEWEEEQIPEDVKGDFENIERDSSLYGTIQQGIGEGKYYVTHPEYHRCFQEILKINPFPGTLNIKIDTNILNSLKPLFKPVVIKGFKTQTRSFGSLECYKCLINDEKEGWIIFAERTTHPDNIIEIISEYKIVSKDNKIKVTFIT